MNVDLCAETERIIADHVKSGRFSTPAAVIEAAVESLVVDESLDADDLAAIAEADAEIDRGEGLTIEQVRAHFARRTVKS